MVKKLLRWEDVDSAKPSRGGRMLVFQVAHIGYEGVVEILLGRGDINSDKPDEGGQILLFQLFGLSG